MGPRAALDRCGTSRPPTGIRSPDRPARCQYLYRLSDPGPQTPHNVSIKQGTAHRVVVMDSGGVSVTNIEKNGNFIFTS